jgi:hypothetical protein
MPQSLLLIFIFYLTSADAKVDGYFVMAQVGIHNKLFGNAYFNLKISSLFDEEIRYPNNLELNELLDKGTIDPDRTIIGTLGWEFQ